MHFLAISYISPFLQNLKRTKITKPILATKTTISFFLGGDASLFLGKSFYKNIPNKKLSDSVTKFLNI